MNWIGLICALALTAQGQQPSELRISVKDPSGAPMRVTGSLRALPAAKPVAFVTDSLGEYRFSNLPSGAYELSLAKPGFESQTLSVQITGTGPVSREIAMRVTAQTVAVEVVATTPLAGTNLAANQVAAPVQTATAKEIESSGGLDLADFLNRRLSGVSVNEMQGNPFQPDVNFRGYTASPLLGTPEGLSVYLDGVRQNQPFGDVVSWDLIPKNAISEMTLVPGSDPLFGLNTLGGAVSVQTRNGADNPGWDAGFTYGSSNRKQAQASYGGGKPLGFNWFAAGNLFHESGWRIDSPSDVRQAFARVGWRSVKTQLSLTFSYAGNLLFGNGLQDYRLLAANYTSVYSIPDSTANRSPSLNLIARHTFNESLGFSGNAWYRHIHTNGVNANLNTGSFDQSVYQPSSKELSILAAAGYTGIPASGATAANTPFPKWRCLAEALVDGDSGDRCDAIEIFSNEIQNDWGLSGQLAWISSPGRNQLTVGGSLDRGSVEYIQNTQYGYLNPDRSVTVVPSFQDGTASSNPVDSRVRLHGATPSGGVFFSDTLTLRKTLNLTLSGRYNRVGIDNSDRLRPVAGPGSLDGNYVFGRFNPSLGITWSPVPAVNAYARYAQGSRAPTSIELGCADPANPCSLPNALASDPPLSQVVTSTWEFGLRGKPELSFVRNVRWNAGAFRADNRNDILFVSSPQLGTGYFQNFAKTRREGFDADLDGRIGRVAFGLDYTYLLATYRSNAVLDGSANNTSDTALAGFSGLDGNIYVHPGNRIPLIPKQNGKAWAEFQVSPKLSIEWTERAVSSSYARGNENNAYKATGTYYLGPGVSAGYALADVRAHYDLTKHLQLALEVDNLFDRHYDTGAQLARTGLSAQGTFLARPFPAYGAGPQSGNYPLQSAEFVTPGAPRRAWMELRAKF
jgi:hypothetical protein